MIYDSQYQDLSNNSYIYCIYISSLSALIQFCLDKRKQVSFVAYRRRLRATSTTSYEIT